MKNSLLMFLLISVILGAAQGQAGQQKADPKAPAAPADATATPTLDQIIDKYVRAVGGKEALGKLSTRVRKGEAEIVGVQGKGEIEEYTKAPNKLMAKLTLPALGLLQYGYDGKTGWRRDPRAGIVDITGSELSYTAFDSTFNRELRLKELYPKLELRGVEKVNGRDAYLVTGTPAGLNPEKLYFDTQSGFLVRLDTARESSAGHRLTEIYLDDYRKVDGVYVPFAERHKSTGLVFIFTFTSVKHNLPLEDSAFVKPRVE
jgi:zinc protease